MRGGKNHFYRLIGAKYSSGDSFEYTYDTVGNRLSETACIGASCTPTTMNYVYDNASLLTSMGGVTYTWGNNGNLLSDGVNTYTYDHANRLAGIQGTGTQVVFGYNGLGDRLQQTVNSLSGATTTNYTLDLSAGLTQVLADGTDTYLYGAGRIAQQSAAGKEYFLGDALGSVRQLADSGGAVSLARNYQPYGKLLASDGSGATSYGFTGEWTSYDEIIYLRTRWYNPRFGLFVTRDNWPGNPFRPSSFHKWVYVENNPVNSIDPFGLASIKIWVSAFIKPATVTFPHVYIPKYNDPTYWENFTFGYINNSQRPFIGYIDAYAKWHGDNRDFYSGGAFPSARVWHKIQLNFGSSLRASLITANTGRTKVDFYYPGVHVTASAKAPSPPHSTVWITGTICEPRVIVSIIGTPDSGKNPLGPDIGPFKTPPIRYTYDLKFNFILKDVTIVGQHSMYPWHEVFIEGTVGYQFSPPIQTPAMLFDSNVNMNEKLDLDVPSDPLIDAICTECTNSFPRIDRE